MNNFAIGLYDPFFVQPYSDFRRPGVKRHTWRLLYATLINFFVGPWTLAQMTIM